LTWTDLEYRLISVAVSGWLVAGERWYSDIGGDRSRRSSTSEPHGTSWITWWISSMRGAGGVSGGQVG